MSSLIGSMLAGLGLFFFGTALLDRHLRALAGRRLRDIFAGLTDNPVKAGWWGFCIGAIAQTASAVTYLTISMVNTGLLPARRALTALNWSNPGTCVLIFFLTLPLNVFTAYVVGIAGILYAFQQPRHARDAVGFVFGISLLFFGLFLMQSTGEQLYHHDWFHEIMSHAHGQYLLVFLVATALTVVAQSGNAVVLVTIVLAQSALLGEDEAVIAIYGVNLGATLITHILTLRLKGTAKQMAMFQVYYGWIGTAVLAPLFFIEVWGGAPLVLSLLRQLNFPLAQELALVNLLWCLVASGVTLLLEGRLEKFLLRKYPPESNEAEDRPRYLYPRCEEDPTACLDLIAQEHRRLAGRLGRYFRLPAGPNGNAPETALTQHRNFEKVAEEVSQVLHALMDRRQSGKDAGALARALEQHDLLGALEREFFQVLPRAKQQVQSTDSLTHRTLEGLEAAWLTIYDAFVTHDPDDIEMALHVSADGGGALARLRENFLDPDPQCCREEQGAALHLLGGCERLVWLANRLIVSVQDQARDK
ncbi:Na/Pi cotransporter family protein [Cerasicoccus frondis]|uniref:Na/Pi cotransporter family protein n=1 Tax=Cerasicoccus frondis TaxID=490090 RepID=UPI002852A932|nr:Na/Pi symporter [Cerasicoccus frondis]